MSLGKTALARTRSASRVTISISYLDRTREFTDTAPKMGYAPVDYLILK